MVRGYFCYMNLSSVGKIGPTLRPHVPSQVACSPWWKVTVPYRWSSGEAWFSHLLVGLQDGSGPREKHLPISEKINYAALKKEWRGSACTYRERHVGDSNILSDKYKRFFVGGIVRTGPDSWAEVRHLQVHPFMLMCGPGELLASAEQIKVNKKRSASPLWFSYLCDVSSLPLLPLLPSLHSRPCSPQVFASGSLPPRF